MTGFATTRILELCERLATYEAHLDSRRDADWLLRQPATAGSSIDRSLWSGSSALSASLRPLATAGFFPWYQEIEADFAELEKAICEMPSSCFNKVLSRASAHGWLSALRRLRAAYEFDKEIIVAKAILDAPDSAKRLEQLIQSERYWTLSSELERVLQDRRRILSVGSGPLPLTGLTIASALQLRVTCFDRDVSACDISRRLVRRTGYRHLVEVVTADALEIADLHQFDAVICAALLGVETRIERHDRKTEIVLHLLANLSPTATLVQRDPAGLGRLFYPPLELPDSQDVEVERMMPNLGPGKPYCSQLVVVRPRQMEVRHQERQASIDSAYAKQQLG